MDGQGEIGQPADGWVLSISYTGSKACIDTIYLVGARYIGLPTWSAFMVRHKTFNSRHLVNLVGATALKNLEEMRRLAEQFIKEHIDEDAVITITETSDAYASTVTVWYRD
jgi:hypothetical protein